MLLMCLALVLDDGNVTDMRGGRGSSCSIVEGYKVNILYRILYYHPVCDGITVPPLCIHSAICFWMRVTED